MKIVGLIPARKGSKRLFNKNIRTICGKNLIEYAIDAGMKSKYINEIFISTNDPLVIEIANKNKVKYIERPEELCTDKATTQDAINHFLEWLPSKPNGIVLLQPTSPLRTTKHIDKCIETFMTGLYDSVATVTRIRHSYSYLPNGAVFVFKTDYWAENMAFISMKEDESIDVDTEIDFNICKMLIERRNEKMPNL